MRIDQFITKLRKDHNIIVGVNGNELKIQAQQKDLTQEIISELREKKAEIIEFFGSVNSKEGFQAIGEALKKDYYKLSSSQKRLYFLYEFDSSSTAYNMPQVVRLEGNIDRNRLDNAFYQLLERHEVLRTSFEIVNKEPFQKINSEAKLEIEHFTVNEDECGSVIKKFIRPFHLSKAPLIRAGLIEVSPQNHILMVDVHHIITDGVSQEVLLKDFLMLYNGESLPELKIQYKDYAEWQQSDAQQKENGKQKAFWLKEFSELPSQLELPTDFARPSVKKFTGSALQFELSHDESQKLQGVADKEGATLFMVMLSIYNIFIKKLSNQDDIIIGTPTAGRQHAELQNMIGMFLNNITLRNQPEDSLSFAEFLSSVKEKTLNCFDNQAYQFEEMINDLKIERDPSRNPLFDIRFVFQNYDKSEFKIPGLTIKPFDLEREVSQFDITLYVEAGDQIKFSFNYSTELFKKETIERFVEYFKAVVNAIIENANQKIADIDIVSEEEKTLLLNDFNSTFADHDQKASILDLFAEQLNSRADEVAVSCGNGQLTYGELDKRSNDLAHQLRGIDKEAEIVGLYVEPSLEMIIGIFGILKAGLGFLPLDPNQRSARQENILKESGCKILVTQLHLTDQLSFDGAKLAINSKEEVKNTSHVKSDRTNSLAYVIYTSGSTGQPKGVKIKDSNVVNYVNWFKEFLQLTPTDKSLLTSSFAFDLGYSSIFPVLLSGGELHLIASDVYQSPNDLLSYINNQQITYLKVTPSLFSTFTMASNFGKGSLTSLRYIVMGGEQIRMEPIEKTHKIYPEIQFINHYGPTETTIGAIAEKIEDIEAYKKRPTIGKPINNTQLYILSRNEKLLPLGVAGELCIAGSGVGNGYLNMSEMTVEKFVSITPYAEVLYKTGDLARWLPDGRIEFLGRIDNQIKIRGYRIELGEIENLLLSHKEVTAAVVIARENEGEKYLVSYYLSSEALDSSVLKDYLSEVLPDYMVPAQFVWLESMPLTPNGKLNKKGLPDPEFKSDTQGAKPSTETELILVEIWASLLNIEKDNIGANNDFFERGGNSIMAIRLNYNIQQKFSVQLHMRQVFENPTIKKLAALIEGSQTQKTEEIMKISKSDEYIISSAQQRLFYEHQRDDQGLNYNITNVYRLVGNADTERMAKAFQILFDRHESLRTSFHLNQHGEVVQSIEDKIQFELKRLNIDDYSTLEDAIEDFVRPFDLSKPGLMRGALFQHAELGDFLFLDIHHIICDGISKNILMNDFRRLYKNESLPELDLRYIDYAAWQRNPKSSIAKQKDFWMKKLSGKLSTIELPRLQEKEAVTNIFSTDQGMKLDGELYDRIKNFTSKSNASDFMFLISVYYILLSKISGTTDLIVGTDVAGRTHPKLDNIVGAFVNLLPLRVQLSDEQTYDQFLTHVKESALEAFDNQDFQYDQMVHELKTNGSHDGNIFDVHFTLANYFDHNTELDGLRFELVQLKWSETSQFEFKVHAVDEGDRFLVHFVYNRELYDDDTMNLLLKYYKNILLNVLADSSVKIPDIEIENTLDVVQEY